VKSHPWFKDYDWEKLRNKEIQAPFKPHETGSSEDMRKHFKKVKWREDPALMK